MRAVLCVALTVALAGCAATEPIANVLDARATAGSGKTLTRAEVARAIERAGRSVGWQMSADAPGVFTGRLLLRSHVAVVTIEHDADAYSIRYRESVNLDARDGEIHNAYNRWVERLNRAIREELAQL